MEILVINHFFDRVEAELIAALSTQGFRFTCLTNPKTPFRNIVEDCGIPVLDFPIASRISPRAILGLRKILRGVHYNLIHTFSNRGLATAILSTPGSHIPIIGYRGTVGNISRFDPTSWITYLHPRVSCISCVSKAVYQSLLETGISEEKLVQIYKGHKPEWYRPALRESLLRFGIPEQAVVVCCSANVRPNKGVDVLLQAAETFLAEDRSARLLLFGEIRDPKVKELIEKHPHKDRIHCPGFIEDAYRFVGACDVFVMPSVENEGFPKAVIEAMSMGLACIVTDVGGLPEQVIHEHTGYVVPARHPVELSRVILKLVREPARRGAFGRLAESRLLSEFSFERMVEEYADLYRRLAANGEQDSSSQA